MNTKKWIPWNGLKKEEEDSGKHVPIHRPLAHDPHQDVSRTLDRFHQDIDRSKPMTRRINTNKGGTSHVCKKTL